MKKYQLRLNKIGDITAAVEYLREHQLVDDEALVGMMLKSKVPVGQEGMILRLVLLDPPFFNDQFQLSVIHQRTGNPVVRKPFETYHNIKQLAVLGACLDPELSESTVRSIVTTLRHITSLEKELGRPFWQFHPKQIQTVYEQMAKEYSHRTVITKIGLLIKADDKLRELASLEPDNQLDLPENRYWYESAHNKDGKSARAVRRIRRDTYSLELINRVLRNSDPTSAVAVLLAFKGVKTSRNINENEMGLVKVGDFRGNQLSIYGRYPRKIPFSDREMSLIQQLRANREPGAYLFQPENRRPNNGSEPLKRWAITERRIKGAGQTIGVRLTYRSLRRSGQIAFAEAYLLQRSEDALPGKKLLWEAFRTCQLRFGDADEADLQNINSRSRFHERFRVFVDNLKRSIKQDQKAPKQANTTDEDRVEEDT